MPDEKFTSLNSLDALSPRGLAGKREYVTSLEARGDPESLALLLECLGDESGYLRDLAEAALVRIGEPAVPALAASLGHGLWYSRMSAARALGQLVARHAVESLCGLFSEPNLSVVQEAAGALLSIARAGGAVPVARGLFRLPEVLRARAVREMTARDRALSAEVQALFSHTEVMLADPAELLSEDAAVVRASEEGVAWEILTAPRGENGHGRGGAAEAPDAPGSVRGVAGTVFGGNDGPREGTGPASV